MPGRSPKSTQTSSAAVIGSSTSVILATLAVVDAIPPKNRT